MADDFRPDWAIFGDGYECGIQEAADYCKEHINYADSTMDHEELLMSVYKGILAMKPRLKGLAK